MAEVETYGTGQVEWTADQAGLRVFYAAHAGDRTSAVSALTERVSTVESVLGRDGVEVLDRQLTVHDDWDGEHRSGAQANQSYALRITDLSILNDLVADLVVAEPDNLFGPSWELANHDDAMRQAQHEAVADATRRAESYVEALGRRVGQLLRVSDGADNPQPVRFAAEAAVHLSRSASRPDIAGLSLEPQRVTVTATCTMAWTITE
ncbi:MAG TPA: SIMPL domain-containing protein [Pseudonocardiaceae bacterium]|nr:SIMPL domain-containing protein [Pseudonocardiaceae bacterium]